MHFPKQFLLAKTPLKISPLWRQVQYLGWWLSLAPEVQLIKVLDSNDKTIGLIIGWPLFRGRLLKDGDTIRVASEEKGLAAEYEEIAGRFLYFFQYRKKLAVVTDAAGLMPLVYSPEHSTAASTPAVLQRLVRLEQDEKICNAFAEGKRETWYPFGVTPYLGVRRLLPNHRLTIADGRCERFFPLPGDVELRGQPDVTIQDVCDIITQWVSENVKALVNAGHNVAHLTGGFDSRMILAASRDLYPRMRFQTIRQNDTRNRLDCHIAHRIARKFDLDYQRLEFIPPDTEEMKDWLIRTGHCIEDSISAFCTTARVYNQHCHELTGTCGEAMRAVFWYPGDDQLQELTPREFMHRVEIPVNEVTTDLCRKWLAGLPPGISVGNLLDIAYIELRVACWAGPSMYGHDITYPSISPFSGARYYKAILSLPEKLRMENMLASAFVKSLWPELLQFPVNRASGLARLRFLSQEIRRMLPIQQRDQVKRILQTIRRRKPEVHGRFQS